VKFANRERFPEADLIVVEDFAAAALKMTLGSNTYAVVVTRGHKGDADALAATVGKGLRFVGLLGSKPKVVHIFSALEERGIPRQDLVQVHSPLGLEIGATTPEEIAVSILAEMIAIRRGVDPSQARSMRMELPGRMRVGS
jgi:xanthine dehydrogenase accessory factor